ncbi:uncharacterized protein LOC117339758 [Pecten maximus]|uniref:uncharacterized protein LOC117339758 n=1 Tax=Pecten maximus TaxID=6579 RepID=UPI0014590A34|nr:uncharacterized protein LOC117339758 [Pecten maximus]
MSSETVSAQKKLSSSLKERLKRCGRYHSSPISAPPRKRISYPVSTLQQTPVITELDGKGDHHQGTLGLSTPPKSAAAAGCINKEIRPDLTHVKPNYSTPTNKKDGFSNTVENSSTTYGKHSLTAPHTFSNPSPISLTQKTSTNEIPSTYFPVSNLTVSAVDIHSCCKQKSGEDTRHSFLSSTPDTTCTGLVQKNNVNNEGENEISELRYERTPIRSRNVSSCCRPSRLHFPGMSNNSFIDSDTSTGSSPGVGKQLEQLAGFQITPLKETQSANNCGSSDDAEMLQEEYERLKNTLREKEEELRKLNMVKMYRTKNDLDSLGVLVRKWRITSQQALIDLHNKLPEPKPSLTQLIDHLKIEHSIVQFNPEEEAFSNS